MSKNDNISGRTISEKLALLGELTAWFESDEFSLEQALEKYADAEHLVKEIERELTELRNKVTILDEKFAS